MSDTTTILVLGLAAIFGYKFLVLDKKGGGGAPAPVPDVPAVGVPQPPAAEGEKPAEGGGGEKPAEGGEKGAKGDKAKKEEYPAAGGEGEAPKEEKKKKKAKYANAYYSAYLNEGSSLYSLNRIGNCL